MADNTIRIVAEYVQENEDALKDYREDLQGMEQDVEELRGSTDNLTAADKQHTLSLTDLRSGYEMTKEVVGAVYDVAKDLYGAFSQAAEATRDLSIASGTTAEEASVLLQVLDDYQISAADVTAASRQMKEKGMVPTLETLAQLSDQFLAIEDPAKRLEFAQDNLGRSYSAYLNVLEQGGDKLRQNATEVNKNLILSDEQIASYEEQRLALDALNDTVEGAKVAGGAWIGTQILTISNSQEMAAAYRDLYGEMTPVSTGTGALTEGFTTFTAQMERGAAMTEFYNAQLGDTGTSTLDLAADTEILTAANSDLLGLMSSISSETKSYIDQQEQVKTKQAEVKAQIDELIAAGWSPLSDKVKDLQTDYDNLGVKFDQNAAKHTEAMNKILYDLYLAKLSVGGLDDAEMKLAQQAGLAFGQLDQASIDTAKNFDTVAQAVTDGKLRVQDMQAALDMLAGKKYKIDVILSTLQNIAQGQQAMSGGGSMMAAPSYNAARGYSTGTSGWMTVPPGYPNDSYPVMVESGERFAVLPAGASAAPSGGGGMGGGNVTVVVQIQSPVTILDQQQGQAALLDYIEYGVKTLQERGVI